MEYRIIIIHILLYNRLLLSVNSSSVVDDDVKAPQYCQWDPPAIGNHGKCLERCSKKKGFIHSVQRKFLCSNEHEKPGSPRIRKSKTFGGMYDCECEHPDQKRICNPPILYVNVSKDQCDEICGKFFVLIYVQNEKREAYCEEASNIKLFDLEAETLHVVKPKKKSNIPEFSWSKICKCGINLKTGIEKKKSKKNVKKKEKRYSKPLDELDHLCTVGEFMLSSKELCEKKCTSAKAFFHSNNELICYHERREADVISSENEDCQCGTIINKQRDDEYKLPCYPNQPFEKIPASQCGIVCESLSAYIFKGKLKRIVTYCDSRTDPPKGFDRLKPQFKRFRRPSPSQRPELPCSCGVNTSPLSKKQNTSGDSSTFEAKRSKINTRHSDSGETEFHVAIDQRNTRNSYGYGSSSQPVTNPIITTNANRNVSTFPTATNQVSSLDLIARDSSYEWITTPNLNSHAGSFVDANNEINKEHAFGNVNLSGIITFFQANTNQRNIPNSNEISTSEINNRDSRNLSGSNSTQAVTNLINVSNLNQNNSVFPIATREETEQNLLGSDGSFGVSANLGITPHSIINDGTLQAAAHQILSRHRSIRSASPSHAVSYLKITRNSNVYYASSTEAVQNLRTAQDPNICASSSGAVQNLRTAQDPNIICASSSEAVQNLRTAQDPNICASSSGAVQNLRTAQDPNIICASSSEAVQNLRTAQDPNICASSSGAVQNLRTAQDSNICASASKADENIKTRAQIASQEIIPTLDRNASYFLSATKRLSKPYLVRSPSSSHAFPNRHVAQNPNIYVSSSKYASNENSKRMGDDSVSKIPGDSFVNSLELSDIPEVQSLEDIPPFHDIIIPPFDDIAIPSFDDSTIPPFDDIIVESINEPVENRNVPSQSPISTNTNTFNNNESSSFLRDNSNERKGISSRDSTNKKANHEDDIFGQILQDVSLNWSSGPVIQPLDVATSNFLPVADFNYPPQFDDYFPKIQ